MTKQEEIREGMEQIACFCEGDCKVCLGEQRMFLHKKGVVIKVDRELPLENMGIYPKSVVGGDNPYEERSPYQNGWNDALLKLGRDEADFGLKIVAIEPLVGGVKNDKKT